MFLLIFLLPNTITSLRINIFMINYFYEGINTLTIRHIHFFFKKKHCCSNYHTYFSKNNRGIDDKNYLSLQN